MSAVVTLLSWRSLPWRVVTAGLSSWQAGLALAFEQHLQWGPQVVFTFGPYGFVEDVLPFFRGTAVLGLVYALVVTGALAALVIGALRASWGLLPASVAAWVSVTIAANLLEAPELALATALGLALACLRAGSEKARLALLTALGALAGFQVLVEVNVGLVTAVLAVLAVAGSTDRWGPGAVRAGARLPRRGRRGPRGRRPEPGQLRQLPPRRLAVAIGYGSAMGSSAGRRGRGLVRRRRRGPAGAWSSPWPSEGRPRGTRSRRDSCWHCGRWETLKEGFVRHDLHDLTFFGLLLVALGLARVPRRLVPVQAVSIALAALMACLANGALPAVVALPGRGRAGLVRRGGRPVLRRPLGAGTGHGPLPGPGHRRRPPPGPGRRPWPASPWPPSPGTTPSPLPTRNCAGAPSRSCSPTAPTRPTWTTWTPPSCRRHAPPQRILYQPIALDGRDPFWDPPATMVATVLPLPPAVGERPLAGAGPGPRPLRPGAGGAPGPRPLRPSPSTFPSSPATSSWLRSRSARRSWPGPKAFSSSRPPWG